MLRSLRWVSQLNLNIGVAPRGGDGYANLFIIYVMGGVGKGGKNAPKLFNIT